MSVLTTLRFWWRAVASRSQVDSEVEEEFQHHLSEYAHFPAELWP